MKVLETILSFLTTLARIIFPRKRKPSAGSTPGSGTCPDPLPDPLPAPPIPPLPPDAGDGSDDDLHRGDTLAGYQGDWGDKSARGLYATGCCLMLTGAAGCIYKWFIV